MVRVLPNGEVVSDDDPRVRGNQTRQRAPNVGNVNTDSSRHQTAGEGVGGIWDQANQRLRAFGIPEFEVAGYTIEPAYLVVGILALVMFGPMALIIVAVLVYLNQNNRQNAQPAAASGGSTSQNPFHRDPNSFQGGPSSGSASKPSSSKGPFSGTGARLGS